jgi:hypothetical protein
MTSTVEQDVAAHAGPGRRQSWAWWGALAGALGAVTNVGLSFQHGDGLVEVDVVDRMTRGLFHAAAVTGYLAAAALLLFAAGLWGWAERRASTSLARRAAPMVLVAAGHRRHCRAGRRGDRARAAAVVTSAAAVTCPCWSVPPAADGATDGGARPR